jgi:hypothetical protein
MAATCVVVPLGPACVNITGVRSGDRNQFTITLTQKGVPVDLTDQTVAAQARKTTTATDALDGVVVVTDAANGELTLRWPGDAVATWLAGKGNAKGVWDLQVYNGVDDPVTMAAGSFDAQMDVTRP